MTREEFYRLTDILNSEVLGNFMHGGEADELIAMFEEAVERSGVFKEDLASNDLDGEDSFDELLQELYIKYDKEVSIEKLLDISSNFANWQKQLMMKDAVPATVLRNQHGNKYIQSMSGLVQYDKFEIGDIVKVMFMKED